MPRILFIIAAIFALAPVSPAFADRGPSGGNSASGDGSQAQANQPIGDENGPGGDRGGQNQHAAGSLPGDAQVSAVPSVSRGTC